MCWNESGSLILSGSDDQYLKITDPFNRNVSYSLFIVFRQSSLIICLQKTIFFHVFRHIIKRLTYNNYL